MIIHLAIIPASIAHLRFKKICIFTIFLVSTENYVPGTSRIHRRHHIGVTATRKLLTQDGLGIYRLPLSEELPLSIPTSLLFELSPSSYLLVNCAVGDPAGGEGLVGGGGERGLFVPKERSA